MRIKERHFNVPFCLLQDGLPNKVLALAVALFSAADFEGRISLSYIELSHLCGIKRRNTISASMKALERRGWIFHRKRSNQGAQTIWVQVPPRYRSKPKKTLPSIVSEVSF